MNDALRTHRLKLLDWQDAHAKFDSTVEDLLAGFVASSHEKIFTGA